MTLAHAPAAINDPARQPVAVGPLPASSGRFRAGSFLIYLFSFLLAGSSAAKLMPVPKVASQMALVGFAGGRLTLIAVLEIVSAFLFAYPRTRSFGLLMVSAYLGGAIAAHVGHGQVGIQPAVVLGLIWFATWLRHPQLLAGRN
jgi:hypothetical protein